ncbi:prepilin-type N-terminal cleavage/methylation domain-containing protein [Lysobacter sp. A6]|uniref:Prepilin-type N-terminal cleavage/methylation domain-containing protein n=1 Tax=Noviluteimonas lactosilytica TaxID=2888523 RepID=A0ABS8JFQ3_9GAMM|nr:prepilin-type N-terminal cleavage/methylation domain-containing protein [Lysobacter lactosilyticus]MCC8362416.1 prepilin-type N-terminal cleavage/methylation domain-containing protein [Lysobacter lactosilyticus]
MTLSCRRRERGFSLIEMMVAMALSLIVAAAVVALVVAIVRSNRQTLQSTRLHQELRATLNLVANDMRRARSVGDPLTVALAPAGNPVGAIDTANAGCIIYGYEGAASGPWHIVRVDDGNVVLATNDDRPADCADGDATTTLGSPQVEITDIAFTPSTDAASEMFEREFTITLSGRLVDTNPNVVQPTRTMSQTVYVRSVGAGI